MHKSEDLTRIFEGRHGPDDGTDCCCSLSDSCCSLHIVAACYEILFGMLCTNSHLAAGFFVYGRHYSPSVCHLGRQLAALEGTEAGYATASGLSSIACALLNLCNTGDHIVASNTLYGARCPWQWPERSTLRCFRRHRQLPDRQTCDRCTSGGTFALLSHFFPTKMGITTTFVDMDDWDAVNAAVQPGTKVRKGSNVPKVWCLGPASLPLKPCGLVIHRLNVYGRRCCMLRHCPTPHCAWWTCLA